MTAAPDDTLPDADYVLVGSRVALGLDGGFAVAVPTRRRLLASAGAPDPLQLSVDGASPEVHAAQRQAFVDAGLLDDTASARNLFDDIVADPSWLFAAGEPAGDAAGTGIEYRVVQDTASARPIVSLPVFRDDPTWHLSDAAIIVHAPGGDRVLRGFRSLYAAWLTHIADERRAAAGGSRPAARRDLRVASDRRGDGRLGRPARASRPHRPQLAPPGAARRSRRARHRDVAALALDGRPLRRRAVADRRAARRGGGAVRRPRHVPRRAEHDRPRCRAAGCGIPRSAPGRDAQPARAAEARGSCDPRVGAGRRRPSPTRGWTSTATARCGTNCKRSSTTSGLRHP